MNKIELSFSRVIHISILAVMIVAMVASCAPAQTAATQPAASGGTTPAVGGPTQAPAVKGVFTFGRYMDAVNPDPVMQDANADIWYIQQYYSGLLRFKPDNTVEPELATDVPTAANGGISADGLTYTFNLRPNLKFCDGSPVTAADWLWSLNRARDPNNGIWSFTLDAVASIDATDTQVVFHLKNPYVPFIYSAALFNTVVMPQKLVEAAGGWENFKLKPCGTGPYIMKEWVKGDHMLLVKNPYYWEPGKPATPEIMIKTIPDDNSRILALQKGDVDAINYPPFNRVADLKNDPNLVITQFPSTYTNYITINNRNKPFDSVDVRQALSYAIDRNALIQTINFGVGQPATTFRPRGSLYYNDSLPGWPYDVQKAKDLLTKAGYPNGFTTEFDILSGNTTQQQIATIVKDMWSKVGVTINIVTEEQGIWNDNYYNNNYVMQVNGWTDDIPDPSEETNYAMVNATSECFHTGYSNPTADKLAADAVMETDPAKREAMYKQIQQIFNTDLPFIPLWHEPYLVIASKKVNNFYQTPLGSYIWRDLTVSQ